MQSLVILQSQVSTLAYFNIVEVLLCITNSQFDQLPVGFIAHLIEYFTGIAEVMGSNPVQARLNFSQALISQQVKLRWSVILSYYSPHFKYMNFISSLVYGRLRPFPHQGAKKVAKF